MFGVSPSASCSCRLWTTNFADHDRAGVNADSDLEGRIAIRPYGPLHPAPTRERESFSQIAEMMSNPTRTARAASSSCARG